MKLWPYIVCLCLCVRVRMCLTLLYLLNSCKAGSSSNHNRFKIHGCLGSRLEASSNC